VIIHIAYVVGIWFINITFQTTFCNCNSALKEFQTFIVNVGVVSFKL